MGTSWAMGNREPAPSWSLVPRQPQTVLERGTRPWCVGDCWCRGNVLNHRSKLDALHHHKRRADHGCRHEHRRCRFRRERWTQLHHFLYLRRRHLENESGAQGKAPVDLSSTSYRESTWNSVVTTEALTPFHQRMLSGFFNKLSPIQTETGRTGVDFSMKSIFELTALNMLFISFGSHHARKV